jgi:Tol biopolymer transport system component/DNA-binding winged helix-turn-helix (wHTH) protein
MTVRFGPYEVDTASAELRKHGLRVQLQEQPFRILTALLDRPGEVVSREDLISRLWADGTHVDYDRGLNAAVTRLRQALSDSAERPRYVETVSRRGYRFIAPIEGLVERDAASAAPDAAPHRERTKRHLVWIVAGCVAIAIVPMVLLLTRRESALPAPHVAPLTSYQGVETEPSFSPDGSQVAFSWNGESQTNFDIYVQTVGSGAPLRLTTDGAADRAPAWSPDGRFIAFRRDGQGILLVPPTGGAERTVVVSSVVSGQLSWSADSRHIVFATGVPESNEGGIFAVRAEGGHARRLITPESVAQLRGPAMSPDGRLMAFASCRGTDCDLSVAEVDGQLNITSAARTVASKVIGVRSVAWTPDSDAVLFSQGPDWGYIGQRVWRVGTRPGASPELLGFAQTRSGFPAVSRAGSRLAYSMRLGEPDVWRIENGLFSRSAFSSTQLDMSVEFSPDGKRVVFASSRSGNPEIWVADADGANPFRLTFSNQSGSPRWSPDGKSIVYDTQVSGGANWDIHIMNAAGGQSAPVAEHPSRDYAPSFSRDGKSIYFVSNRSGKDDVYRVAISGGAPERLTDGGGGPALESPDGKSVYFLKTGGHHGGGCHPLFEFRTPEAVPRKLADSVCNRGFAVTKQGIYYVTGRLDGGPVSVELLDPASGRVRVIASSDNRFYLAQGLSVSPDGQVLLMAGTEQIGADLYLVENFR